MLMPITFYDPLEGFTDREYVLTLFKEFLLHTRPSTFRLLAIKGNSGTGKTFLTSYLVERVCRPLGWQVGLISFTQAQPDFRFILARLEDALKGCVSREGLNAYRAKRDKYNERFDDYRTSIIVNQSVEAKGLSAVSDSTQKVQINTQLRERELHLRSELSSAIIELAEECIHPVCCFIDSYERLVETDSALVGWLLGEVLPGLAQANPQPMLVVTSGWEWPKEASIAPFIHQLELSDFDVEQTMNYLKKQEVITVIPATPSLTEKELITAFYGLTRGHPLVLSLAVTYFKELPPVSQTAQVLQSEKLAVDERARTQFLEERLLMRLPEPYRTLLERGPILRSFDQASLNVLLRMVNDAKSESLPELDDRMYSHFLSYPFVKQVTRAGSGLYERPSFHDLVRQVRLEALRYTYTETKKQLHQTMIDYYANLLDAEEEGNVVSQRYEKWFADMSEKNFSVIVEWFYHSLQVEEFQDEAFAKWIDLTSSIVYRWRRQQARPLLEVVRQLSEEGEPFLNSRSYAYGQYLFLYAKFLDQEAHWDDAKDVLETALVLFERMKSSANIALVLNNMGVIYQERGQLKQALEYFERALSFFKEIDDTANTALILNNMGVIYQERGQLKQALEYFERALPLFEEIGNTANVALVLNNIGMIYQERGQLKQALDYYERALPLSEEVSDIVKIALVLNNMGIIYQTRGQLEEALDYYNHALPLFEEIQYTAKIALVLNNIGMIHQVRGQLEEALAYFERALPLFEEIGNAGNIALVLHNTGIIYQVRGKLEEALGYFERALLLFEEIGNAGSIASGLSSMGSIYQARGKLEEALGYYERALFLFEEIGNAGNIAFGLNNIAGIYQARGQFEEALEYYERALPLFEEIGNAGNIALVLNNTGMIYLARGKLEEALGYFERALPLFEEVGNAANIAMLLNNIGMIYRERGNLKEALGYFGRALPLFEEIGNTVNIALVFNNIGMIYREQGQLEFALEYLERALPLFEEIGNTANIALVLNNTGLIYQEQGKTKDALEYLERALPLFEEIGNTANIALVLNNTGLIYQVRGEIEEALGYFERALPLLEKIGNTANIALVLNNIGMIYREQEKLEEALEYLERSLPLFEEIGNIANIALVLSNTGAIYLAWGQLEEALGCFERSLPLFEEMGSRPNDLVFVRIVLGTIYQEQAKWQLAIDNFMPVISFYEQQGEDSGNDFIHVLEALANCYSQLGKQDESLMYGSRAQHIRELSS